MIKLFRDICTSMFVMTAVMGLIYMAQNPNMEGINGVLLFMATWFSILALIRMFTER